jgi:hypothetical protein
VKIKLTTATIQQPRTSRPSNTLGMPLPPVNGERLLTGPWLGDQVARHRFDQRIYRATGTI